MQESYRKLSKEVFENYNTPLQTIDAIGLSAMIHGYMAFDKDGGLLVPFRTWRNTTTAQAAKELTRLFQFNVPHRWSVAHLYQAILNKQPHIKNISYQTTLAGYVHWKLTGQKVLGIGDASGMCPIDSKTNDYDASKIELFNERLEAENIAWKLTGEGGAWGIALLASYMLHKEEKEPLEAYLFNKVFAEDNSTMIPPDQGDVHGFTAFMERYKKGLPIERIAADALK